MTQDDQGRGCAVKSASISSAVNRLPSEGKAPLWAGSTQSGGGADCGGRRCSGFAAVLTPVLSPDACERINLEHNAADPPGVIGVVITPARGQEAPKGLVPSFEEFFEASYASVASALVLLVGGRRSR